MRKRSLIDHDFEEGCHAGCPLGTHTMCARRDCYGTRAEHQQDSTLTALADQRARADAALMALAEIAGAPTPVDGDGKCWYCSGGLGIGPNGHKSACPLVATRQGTERGAALLAAADAMADEIRHGISDGAPFRDCNETGCPHPWCAILHARKRWRALGRGGEGR